MNDEPEIVHSVLKFLYTGSYSDLPESRESISSAQINVRVFALAEKYCIENLLSVAAEKFKAAAQRSWGTDGFAEAVYEAYTTTEDAENILRDTIVNAVTVHFDELFKTGDEFMRFKQVLVLLPGFEAEISQALAEELQRERSIGTYQCPNSTCKAGMFNSAMKAGYRIEWYCPRCQKKYSRTFDKWQHHRVSLAIVEEHDAAGPYREVIDNE